MKTLHLFIIIFLLFSLLNLQLIWNAFDAFVCPIVSSTSFLIYILSRSPAPTTFVGLTSDFKWLQSKSMKSCASILWGSKLPLSCSLARLNGTVQNQYVAWAHHSDPTRSFALVLPWRCSSTWGCKQSLAHWSFSIWWSILDAINSRTNDHNHLHSLLRPVHQRIYIATSSSAFLLISY